MKFKFTGIYYNTFFYLILLRFDLIKSDVTSSLLDLDVTTTLTYESEPFDSDTTTTTTSSTIESPICDELDNSLENGYSVETTNGDFIISILTTDILSGNFIVKRINEIGLIGEHVTLGLRTIHITNKSSDLSSIITQEAKYLEECVEHPLGIFIIESLLRNFDIPVDLINIWSIKSRESIIFPQIAHLLYELPWENQNTSIEVRGDSQEIVNQFLGYSKRQKFCPSNELQESDSELKVILIIGDEILNQTNYNEDAIFMIAPFTNLNSSFRQSLPDQAYVLAEIEINLLEDEETNRIESDENEVQLKVFSSDFLPTASSIFHLMEWLNNSISENCFITQSGFQLSSCTNLLSNLGYWKTYPQSSSEKIIESLKMEHLKKYMNYQVHQKVENNETDFYEMKQIISTNMITNETTVLHYNTNYNLTTVRDNSIKLGQIFYCIDDKTDVLTKLYSSYDMYWVVKAETWVAIGLTMSVLGILLSISILLFIIIRICMDDILEGNPMCTVLLLISLIFLFSSILPFCVEYSGDWTKKSEEITDMKNALCSVRIFLVTLSYCVTFSLLLCRAIMLASIGSEGGFLSHVNGYIQSVICFFSTLVQLGLSAQLLIVMHTAKEQISCENIFYGSWFWALLAYDGCLLGALVFLSPFFFRSQRNYQEGILLLVGGTLCLLVWAIWIPFSFIGDQWRVVAVPLGVLGTGWAILIGIMIPRCFLIVRGIARSEFAQALPSLTSLAFAQSNQYVSEQSIYECVNPAMRQRTPPDESFDHENDYVPSQNEIPTLPLRAPKRNSYNQTNYTSPQHNCNLPQSPSKMTRF